MKNKQKVRIHRNYRVRTAGGVTLGVSEQVFAPIKDKVMRCNGAFIALRGEYDNVMSHFSEVVAEMPEHFTEKSRNYLGYVAYDQVI